MRTILRHGFVGWVIIGAMLSAAPVAVWQQESVNPRAHAIASFTERVKAYEKLRNDAASGIAPLQLSASPAAVTARQKAVAERVQVARREAHQGDVFVPEVVPLIREAVRQDFQQRTPTERRAALKEVPDAAKMQINREYPSSEPLATVPAKLLQNLPRLPEGLEYRLAGRRLILLDAVSNLVVDYVEAAVPEGAKRIP